MSIYVNATHGIVSAGEGNAPYFGWPTVAKLEDGTIVAGASGMRHAHICPWGKSVLCFSKDNGETFGELQVVHSDMIDNRDLGVIAMGGQKFGITWFSTDTRRYDLSKRLNAEDLEDALAYMGTWQEDTVQTLVGSWLKLTEDGGKTWTRAIRCPVSAPHGYMVNKDGTLGYLGKGFDETMEGTSGKVRYAVSDDGGFTWTIRGEVPIPDDEIALYHEPHYMELSDGTLLGAIRYHILLEGGGYDMDIALSRSTDGGKTWSEPVRMNVNGAPPHLMQHSSGAIVMVYGYRHPGYGQRAVVSYDNGETWSDEIIIRDDGPSWDLGYPSSIELDDGSIYTVYYQALPGNKHTSMLWSRWNLPER